jgi:endonuclease-8
MPEGDTIHRLVRVLVAELSGQTLSALALHDRGEVAELAGCTIARIEAVGKHLLVDFSGGWTLRVHLGMHGRWLRRRAEEPELPKDWTVIITVDGVAYVCCRSYRAELFRTSALHVHPRLARLGPDLLADPPRIDDIVQRARLHGHAEREIGDVLLDQRIASGIGNVYKSEVLFEVRVHPRAKVRELSDAQLTRIFETAATLMRLNLLTRRRTTVPLTRRGRSSSQRLWVYMRAGKPCLECGTLIEGFGQGDMARTTYFCPHCQAAGMEAKVR